MQPLFKIPQPGFLKLITAVLIGCSLIIPPLALHTNNSKINAQLKELRTQSYLEKRDLIDEAFFIDSLRYISINQSLCDSSTYVQDSNGQRYLFKSLIFRPILALRFSENDCERCVREEINSMINSSLIKNSRIVILGSIKYNSELKQFVNIACRNIELFYIPDSAIQLNELESLSKPYYIIVKPDLKISEIFYPSSLYANHFKNFLAFWLSQYNTP